jgi:hypothetical protein
MYHAKFHGHLNCLLTRQTGFRIPTLEKAEQTYFFLYDKPWIANAAAREYL